LTIPLAANIPNGVAWESGPWREARTLSLVRNEPEARQPQRAAQIKLLHDGTKLSVPAKCETSDGTPRRGDSFQVLLGTSGSGYARVTVDPGRRRRLGGRETGRFVRCARGGLAQQGSCERRR
jgi:hypothetical protein